MRVVMTVTREYEMDTKRVFANPGFDPPAADASEETKLAWLKESFFELCGWERDEDHVDGSYVRLVDDYTDEVEWND